MRALKFDCSSGPDPLAAHCIQANISCTAEKKRLETADLRPFRAKLEDDRPNLLESIFGNALIGAHLSAIMQQGRFVLGIKCKKSVVPAADKIANQCQIEPIFLGYRSNDLRLLRQRCEGFFA